MIAISNPTLPKSARIRCFVQGAMLYELIPTMPEPRLRPLVEHFGAMLLEIPVFAGIYGTI